MDTVAFPEVGYGPWARRLAHAARELHRRDPVDLVIGSANPNVDFVPGQVLHEEAGVPYVMDYRDAWLLDVFDGHQLHSDRSRAARIERRLVSSAQEIWFVNEGIRTWHAERYPDAADRMHVVMNGHDPGLAPAPRAEGPPDGRPLVFGYIGTISPKVPLEEFVQAWTSARQAGGDLRDARAELHGYLGLLLDATAGDGAHHRRGRRTRPQLRRSGGQGEHRRHLRPVRRAAADPRHRAVRHQRQGVRVHVLGPPGGVGPRPGNAATDVLRGYPLWFPAASLAPADIAAAITAGARAARTATPEVRAQAARFADRYARDNQLLPRVDALLGVAHERVERESTQESTEGAR